MKNEVLEILLWRRMLDADLSQRYFTQLARDYRAQDTFFKIIIALFSSASVASWNIWKTPGYEWIWQTFIGMTTVVAILSPLLKCADKYQKSFNISVEMIDLLSRYETLWAKKDSLTEDDVNQEMQILNKISLRISSSAFDLNVTKRRRIRSIQQQVKKSRGL
ncbi:hypothetical protein [Tichowtungia aerotolerans]|uniref:SMODS and SLOG-associating 2TM effector domain-containing protein n=1 Tax=Tichowtungia aerotolerans TaxID=2697043 RepID=A0A6P1M930_9BACT|nr:hypothetical protein [Tichowtungia aerotolerans]QHI68598.1 hypothetical protein GT409_03745 [Tichowtungia aerotolerans]